ncbi:26S proteasome non-ATPase regulatory subunit 10 [Elysia marginata]|uniref:26S proteasome non-ATPase regulatory subunit 10 n=1 Tax=Elysia marginata TaxID=1093978 RepID=A0AAV4JGV7_9GAST|nr:26S proteasome non-ATPase regulatory subunit 10 [Elysia marginata]
MLLTYLAKVLEFTIKCKCIISFFDISSILYFPHIFVPCSFSHDSLHTDASSKLASTTALAAPPSSKAPLHHQSRDTLQLSRDQLLARIPLFLPWTALPDDPRGQDNSEKINVSPFDADMPKTDIRGEGEAALNTVKQQEEQRQSQQSHQQQPKEGQQPVKKPASTQAVGKQNVAQTKGKPAAKTVKEKQSDTKAARPSNIAATTATKQQQKAAALLAKQSKSTPVTKPNEIGLILSPGEAARPRSGKPKTSPSMLSQTEKTSPRPQSAPKSSSPAARQRANTLTTKDPVQGTGIRSVTPSSAVSRDGAHINVPGTSSIAKSDTASRPASAVSVNKKEGVLDCLSRGLGEEWFQLGVLLGVPYKTLQGWAEDGSLSAEQKADQMLNHWKQTRRTRQDHGVPELLMTLQRLGKTHLVRTLKDRLRTWISDNLEKRGFLKGVVNKNLLEDTENLEPMTPLFLLSLVRKVGFSIDFIYDLGVSRPEVTRIMTDPLLRHREDKMLGLLLVARDKESSADVALKKILAQLHSYDRKEAIQWTLTACRNWLVNQGCADDQFAHGVRDILLAETAEMKDKDGTDE